MAMRLRLSSWLLSLPAACPGGPCIASPGRARRRWSSCTPPRAARAARRPTAGCRPSGSRYPRRQRRAARAARRLLGLHRLEGSLCQARVLAAPAEAHAAAAHGVRLYAAGDAAGARFPRLGRQGLRRGAWRGSTPSPPGPAAARGPAGGRGRVWRSKPARSWSGRPTTPALYLAAYQSRLESRVRRAKTAAGILTHDYVVLEWLGPFAFAGSGPDRAPHSCPCCPGAAAANSGVAAFVQNRRTGEVLQALLRSTC